MSCNSNFSQVLNYSDSFVIPNTTCRVKDPFTDPNNARFKSFGNHKHYSVFELDCRPDNSLRYWIQGTRNPVDCSLSQPFITYSGKNDTIDFMASCSDPKYIGYNRNGRFEQSIYKVQQ